MHDDYFPQVERYEGDTFPVFDVPSKDMFLFSEKWGFAVFKNIEITNLISLFK
jgi:hypothetical protein